MKKRLLICGATGFIGRNLVEHFTKQPEYEVIGVYHKRSSFEHPNLSWVEADLTNVKDVDRVIDGVDIVVQAAAVTSGSKDIVTRPYIHVTDNAVMNSLLLRSAFEKAVKHFVFFSCTVMYPSSAQALKETDFDANAALYERYFGVGWTKVYTEKMCEFFSKISPMKTTVIRHSNIYGPHDKFDLERSHVFGATVTKVMTETSDTLNVWGTGEEERDLLYVNDLTRFVQLALEKQASSFGLYNCGIGKAITIKDLVQKIIDYSGKNLKIKHDLSKPTIKTSLFLNCEKASQELDWAPQIGLDEGIKKTLQWWKENIKVGG
ncbi:MAG: NAD-dependent epimerase/dehydratase family protein [Alphaproteobacteria bacterium]|nr:NAD-dependent epimerase/dehydratase family protein [Alphaproteobacteria bacterium]